MLLRVPEDAVLEGGKIVGFQDKSLLPSYDIFDERRYFRPSREGRVFSICGKSVGITICEDIWPSMQEGKSYNYDPIEFFEKRGVDLIINLAASPYALGKAQRRKAVLKKVVERVKKPIIFVNHVGGHDGVLFDGSSEVIDPSKGLIFQLVQGKYEA